jgi:hypothetical protein
MSEARIWLARSGLFHSGGFAFYMKIENKGCCEDGLQFCVSSLISRIKASRRFSQE